MSWLVWLRLWRKTRSFRFKNLQKRQWAQYRVPRLQCISRSINWGWRNTSCTSTTDKLIDSSSNNMFTRLYMIHSSTFQQYKMILAGVYLYYGFMPIIDSGGKPLMKFSSSTSVSATWWSPKSGKISAVIQAVEDAGPPVPLPILQEYTLHQHTPLPLSPSHTPPMHYLLHVAATPHRHDVIHAHTPTSKYLDPRGLALWALMPFLVVKVMLFFARPNFENDSMDLVVV
jgi:hypothetical protein